MSRLASRRRGTRRAGRCRREFGKNPAAERKSGENSEAGYVQCKFRHREGNKPSSMVSGDFLWRIPSYTNPHGSMKRSGDFIVLLQARTATQDFWQPELANSSLHMADFALGRRGSPDPLRWLAANTAYHVGVSERLGGALLGFGVEARGNRLCNARVQRRSSAGNQHCVAILVAGDRAAFTLAGARAREARVSAERRTHDE